MFHRIETLPAISRMVLIFLAVAVLAVGIVTLLTRKGSVPDMSTASAAGQSRIPPIDAVAPNQLDTATFALG